MPERVTIREDLQIIQVDSFGDVTIDDLMASLQTIVKIHQEREIRKVFIDARKQTSLPSTAPNFEFGSRMAQAERGMRVAVAASPELKAKLEFIATVAENRGAIIQIFDSVEEALAWLTGQRDALLKFN